MSATIKVDIHQLPHGEGLPLPAYQTTDAAGLDLLAAVPAETPLVLASGKYAMVPTGRAPSSEFGTDYPGAPNSSRSWVDTFLHARAGTIYAGSSQIQRNIIGEMVLGLPKEPRA